MRSLKFYLLTAIILLLMGCATYKNSQDEETKKIATAKINTQLGLSYMEDKNFDRAKQKFLLALDQAPSIPDTWYGMGYFLEVTGNKSEAQKYYLKAMALAPQRGDVHNNYGTFLCRNGEYKNAINQFEIASQDLSYMDTAGAFENAGLCALKIPDQKLALLYFDRSMKQDPERAPIYLEMAQVQYKLGEYLRAKDHLETFLKLTTPTPEAYALADKLSKKLKNHFPPGEI